MLCYALRHIARHQYTFQRHTLGSASKVKYFANYISVTHQRFVCVTLRLLSQENIALSAFIDGADDNTDFKSSVMIAWWAYVFDYKILHETTDMLPGCFVWRVNSFYQIDGEIHTWLNPDQQGHCALHNNSLWLYVTVIHWFAQI